MLNIAIISPSVRKGRNSHRIALYFADLIREKNLAEAEILDLLKYNFPLFTERLEYLDSPAPEIIDFAERIKSADAVIIICPEYNGGYPASLKNAVDLLTSEWRRKPVAFVNVSDGHFAGSQVITSIQFSLWKLGSLTIPATLRLPDIASTFDEFGVPSDKTGMDKRALNLINELLWYIEAKIRMSE